MCLRMCVEYAAAAVKTTAGGKSRESRGQPPNSALYHPLAVSGAPASERASLSSLPAALQRPYGSQHSSYAADCCLFSPSSFFLAISPWNAISLFAIILLELELRP